LPGFLPWTTTVDLPLRATRSIWLSTTRPDGRPHAAPVWFVWDGESRRIYFITRRDMQKARNLAHQRSAVAHLGNGDDTLILEGPVTIVTERDELTRVEAAYSAKYVAPRTGQRDTIFQPETDLYRIDVVHVMAWAYGVTDTRTDWRFGAVSMGHLGAPA
jgi:PPOX class probable F420-dependent enzyme